MRKWLTGAQITNDQTRAVADGLLQHGRALSDTPPACREPHSMRNIASLRRIFST